MIQPRPILMSTLGFTAAGMLVSAVVGGWMGAPVTLGVVATSLLVLADLVLTAVIAIKLTQVVASGQPAGIGLLALTGKLPMAAIVMAWLGTLFGMTEVLAGLVLTYTAFTLAVATAPLLAPRVEAL